MAVRLAVTRIERPLQHREYLSIVRIFGAGGRTRTDDLLITNQLLYQLSYAGRLAGDER
jgi:hypothetical protein